jgi:hypothetical protein
MPCCDCVAKFGQATKIAFDENLEKILAEYRERIAKRTFAYLASVRRTEARDILAVRNLCHGFQLKYGDVVLRQDWSKHVGDGR